MEVCSFLSSVDLGLIHQRQLKTGVDAEELFSLTGSGVVSYSPHSLNIEKQLDDNGKLKLLSESGYNIYPLTSGRYSINANPVLSPPSQLDHETYSIDIAKRCSVSGHLLPIVPMSHRARNVDAFSLCSISGKVRWKLVEQVYPKVETKPAYLLLTLNRMNAFHRYVSEHKVTVTQSNTPGLSSLFREQYVLSELHSTSLESSSFNVDLRGCRGTCPDTYDIYQQPPHHTYTALDSAFKWRRFGVDEGGAVVKTDSSEPVLESGDFWSLSVQAETDALVEHLSFVTEYLPPNFPSRVVLEFLEQDRIEFFQDKRECMSDATGDQNSTGTTIMSDEVGLVSGKYTKFQELYEQCKFTQHTHKYLNRADVNQIVEQQSYKLSPNPDALDRKSYHLYFHPEINFFMAFSWAKERSVYNTDDIDIHNDVQFYKDLFSKYPNAVNLTGEEHSIIFLGFGVEQTITQSRKKKNKNKY